MTEGNDKKEACLCGVPRDRHEKIDITKTTTCPYCGIRFESSQEVLVHIFKFHSG